MLEIHKTKNLHNYDTFYIKTNEGIFEISFQPNLDLYWNYTCDRGILLTDKECHDFIITKENYFLYSLIEELYDSIKNETPYKNLPIKPIDKKYPDRRIHKLFKDGQIEWHSDDFEYEKSSILTIKKISEKYKITFKKSKDNTVMHTTFAVRIRNSGSRYNPYNIPFMIMYNKLKEYDNNYQQIHIEEYLHNQKKLTKQRLKIN